MDSETLGQFVQTVRRYVRERLVPIETQVAEEDEMPAAVLEDFRDMGLFGLSTPERYGGLGLGSAEEIEVVMELTWASAAFRSIIGINLGLGSQGILMDGTESQKSFWLPKMASGEVITSFCLTEADSGSDSAALRTTAVREGDWYVLNGTKRYITNAPYAGVFLVMARTSPERLPKNAHISAFLVAADTPGVVLGKKDEKMGQQGAWCCDVSFHDARVPVLMDDQIPVFNWPVKRRCFLTRIKMLARHSGREQTPYFRAAAKLGSDRIQRILIVRVVVAGEMFGRSGQAG